MSTSKATPRRSTDQSDDTCVAPMGQDASRHQSAQGSETLGTSSQSRQLDASTCDASTLADSHSEGKYATETRQVSEECPGFELSFIQGLLTDQAGDMFDVRRTLDVSFPHAWLDLTVDSCTVRWEDFQDVLHRCIFSFSEISKVDQSWNPINRLKIS